MIVNLKKLLFIGVKRDLGDFLVRAQEEGFIEFISPRGKAACPFPVEIQRMMDAIKILRKQPLKAPYRGSGDLAYADEVTDQVLQLKNALEKHEEEKRYLEAEIARVAPFGNFSFEDIHFIENQSRYKIQFLCVKTSKRQAVANQPGLIYVGTEYDLDYFIAVNEKPRNYPGMIEMHFERTVGELKSHLAFVEETLHQIHAELKGFAGHIDFLRDQLLDRMDIYELICAKKSVAFPIESGIFSIEAWVPENKLDQLPALIGNSAIHYESIAVESTDRVPTHMENTATARLGEDLVKLYDIPSYKDKDPSSWVFWSFALFFAIIIADGGYGLVYLVLALFLRKKFSHIKGNTKRLIQMGIVLGSCCIVWGLVTSSFFGIPFEPGGAVGKLSPLQMVINKKAEYHLDRRDDVYQTWVAKYPAIRSARTGEEMIIKAVEVEPNGKRTYEMRDEFADNILLETSILIGVIHICLSMLRYANRRLSNLGWIAFIVGGYLYFPGMLDATSMVNFFGLISPETAAKTGLQLIYGGIGVAGVFALLQQGWKGIGEIIHVIQVFSDILSYLRLYALALAGSIMAHTFNEMGGEIHFVIGALVVLAGHMINILLSTMEGVIQGLRLNFIEWYRYSFEGDGRLFRPLRRLKKLMLQE